MKDVAGPGYTIRPFRSLDDYRACVQLQEAVWGEGFSERVPLSMLKVTQHLGGVAAGAFTDEGRLLGFVFGVTGIEDGRAVHWSDMLAVRPGIRDAGLGTALKAFQRRSVLDLGITRMYWTFDPLESRNAYLNFTKLGVVVRDYIEDMYGPSDSPLHQGLGTDRFLARWELDTERVEDRLHGRASAAELPEQAGTPLAFPVQVEDGLPRPARVGPAGTDDRLLADGPVRVPIPSDIQAVKRAAPDLAAEWRTATRTAFTRRLRAGFEVRELMRAGDLSYYVLSPRRGG